MTDETISNEGFDLSKIKADLVTKDELKQEQAWRDRTINEQQQSIQKYTERVAALESKLSGLSDSQSRQSELDHRRALELTDEENELLADQKPALDKWMNQSLSPQQREIEQLRNKVAELETSNKQFDQYKDRFNAMDEIISRTSMNAIGADKYLHDQSFIDHAQATKYSPYSDLTVWDVVKSSIDAKPGDAYFSQAQSDLRKIFSVYSADQKGSVPMTQHSSGEYQNIQTPQQKKVQDKIERLNKQRDMHLGAGRISEAVKLKDEVVDLELQLGQLSGN